MNVTHIAETFFLHRTLSCRCPYIKIRERDRALVVVVLRYEKYESGMKG